MHCLTPSPSCTRFLPKNQNYFINLKRLAKKNHFKKSLKNHFIWDLRFFSIVPCAHQKVTPWNFKIITLFYQIKEHILV